MFKKNFKIVEVRDDGITVTHCCRGNRKEIERDIIWFKQLSKRYEMIGNDGMVVWI